MTLLDHLLPTGWRERRISGERANGGTTVPTILDADVVNRC